MVECWGWPQESHSLKKEAALWSGGTLVHFNRVYFTVIIFGLQGEPESTKNESSFCSFKQINTVNEM